MVPRPDSGPQSAALSLFEISLAARYALRGLRPLVRAFQARDRYVLAGDVAREEGLPACFLSKIFQKLARRGLLRSRRGPGGGYALAAPPQSVSLADVVRAAQDERAPSRCVLHPGWGRRRCCAIHAETRAADARLSLLLSRLTLKDMTNGGL